MESVETMKVLVTGDNGYIGSVLVSLLVERGHAVTGLDTEYFSDCSLFPSKKTPRFRKDVRDIAIDDLKQFDAIIHLAALSNDPLGALNTELTQQINYQASLHLAHLAKDAGIKTFIFSSSCSVYGHAEGTVDENTQPHPLTAYAISKLSTEEGLRKLASSSFHPVLMRNSTVYGLSPQMRFDLVLNSFVGWAVTKHLIEIRSDGTPWRPLIHVQDLALIFVYMLEHAKELSGQIINTGFDEQNYQVRDLAETVHNVSGATVRYTPTYEDSRSYRVSFKKLQKLCPEIVPHWDVQQGTKEMINFFNEHPLSFDEFTGRFARLRYLQKLIREKKLDSDLRWKAP